MKKILLLLAVLALFSCTRPEDRTPQGEQDTPVVPPDDNPKKDTTDTPAPDKYGIAYMFDGSVIPELHITVPLDDWNTLLACYDANNRTKRYVSCSLRYVRGEEECRLESVGLRLKGGSSRRRPEMGSGQHDPGNKRAMQHCHFTVNFRHFIDDKSQEIHGCKGIRLKFFNLDPSYVREPFCYEIFRQYGIWTAINSCYCRLWLKVEGDPEETYYGVYILEEPINKTFVKQREALFGSREGNLWKCRYWSKLDETPASIGVDLGGDEEYIYEYKLDEKDFEAAKEQLNLFRHKLVSLTDDEFRVWIQKVCDVELLLKTYAVNVAVGMWDDYWYNANNYYLYFNSRDPENYKFYFIPFDYDISLGDTTEGMDAGRRNPLEWGDGSNPLIHRILKYDDFRRIYTSALQELTQDGGLLCEKNAVFRIKTMQNRIRSYVYNETGEDLYISDRTAGWSFNPEYRLTEDSADNFFRVKAESVRKYCTE